MCSAALKKTKNQKKLNFSISDIGFLEEDIPLQIHRFIHLVHRFTLYSWKFVMLYLNLLSHADIEVKAGFWNLSYQHTYY